MDSSKSCICSGHLAMAEVPKQEWCEPYDWCTALAEGTIFPCLNLTFYKAPIGKCTCKPCSDTKDATQQEREQMLS